MVSTVISYCGSAIDNSLPVKGRTEVVTKYKRKIGNYYLSTGVWWPNVEIGRAEYWYYKTAYQQKYSGGPYIPYHKDNIPNSAEDDYNKALNKDHYTDNAWIKSKSLSLKNTGNTYYDIFG